MLIAWIVLVIVGSLILMASLALGLQPYLPGEDCGTMLYSYTSQSYWDPPGDEAAYLSDICLNASGLDVGYMVALVLGVALLLSGLAVMAVQLSKQNTK